MGKLEFIGIEVSYPPAEVCCYPEYKGKPYFAIKYKEDGQYIVGFGTYNPEVLSRYIKEYFIFICALPEGHGRLVDADAYSAEMKDRQEAAWKWRNEAIEEEDEVKLARAEGAFTAFTEAKLTMDKHIIRQRNSVAELLKEDA